MINFWVYYSKQGRHATNDASIMCNNGCVGCGVGGVGNSDDDGAGCNDGGNDSGGDIVTVVNGRDGSYRSLV